MASIKIINGRYYVQVRKKGKTNCASFADKETAELWGKFKEDIIDEMEAFDFQVEYTITLEEAVQKKRAEYLKRNVDKKSLTDLDALERDFSEFLKTPLHNISDAMLIDKLNNMKRQPVFKGGRQDGKTGIKSIQAPATLLRKFRILASVYSFLIQNGAKLSNPAQHIVNRIKMSIACAGNNSNDHL